MTTRFVFRLSLLTALLATGSANAVAAEVKALVARELEPVIAPLIASFERETRHTVNVVYGTAGQLRRVGYKKSGNDVLVASSQMIEEVAKRDVVQSGGQHELGRIGIGVFVREGVAPPAIGTPDELRKSLLAANGIVYSNQVSGRQFAKLVDELGITAELQAKTTRLPDDAAVVEHIRGGKSADIGVASTLQVMPKAGKELRFVGRVSRAQRSEEGFTAAALNDGPSPAAGRALVDYLAAPAAKARLQAAGL